MADGIREEVAEMLKSGPESEDNTQPNLNAGDDDAKAEDDEGVEEIGQEDDEGEVRGESTER